MGLVLQYIASSLGYVGLTQLPWMDSGISLPRWLELVFLVHAGRVYKLRGARAFRIHSRDDHIGNLQSMLLAAAVQE